MFELPETSHLVTVRDICRIISRGMTHVYAHVMSGALPTVRKRPHQLRTGRRGADLRVRLTDVITIWPHAAEAAKAWAAAHTSPASTLDAVTAKEGV